MRSRRAGWLLWGVVVFGLYGAGLRHERLLTLQHDLDAGRWPGTVDAVRAYLTNDGDLRRTFAYVEAALGRPYQSYYVRSAEGWRQAFRAHEPYRPDALPTIAPARPLAPYRDFLVEYPPGFLVAVLPIALAASDANTFVLLFETLMAAALTGALALSVRAARRRDQPIALGNVMSWGALAALLLGVVATHRFDAAVALAIALAAFAMAARRPRLLGVALGAAVALKGAPLVVLPIFGMHALRERRAGDLGRTVGAVGCTVALACLPAAITAGPRLLETLRYHADRPVHIESTWGALLGLVHAAAPAWVTVEKTFGSTNLVGPLGPAAGVLSGVAILAGLGAVYLAAWRRLAAPLSAERARATLEATTAALAVFIALGKVCSPQFLVWILPLGLVLCLTDGRRPCLVLFLALLLVTQIIYPICYRFLEALSPAACLLVLGRNLLLLTWAALLLQGAPNETPARSVAIE